jgi:hypothetical protein
MVVDGYSNKNGGGFNLPLVASDTITFLKLADYAYIKSLAIGLKNTTVIVHDTISTLDCMVNEQYA